MQVVYHLQLNIPFKDTLESLTLFTDLVEKKQDFNTRKASKETWMEAV